MVQENHTENSKLKEETEEYLKDLLNASTVKITEFQTTVMVEVILENDSIELLHNNPIKIKEVSNIDGKTYITFEGYRENL